MNTTASRGSEICKLIGGSLFKNNKKAYLLLFFAIVMLLSLVGCFKAVFDEGLGSTSGKRFDEICGEWLFLDDSTRVSFTMIIEHHDNARHTIAQDFKYTCTIDSRGNEKIYEFTMHDVGGAPIACVNLGEEGKDGPWLVLLVYRFMTSAKTKRIELLRCYALEANRWVSTAAKRHGLVIDPKLAKSTGAQIAFDVNSQSLLEFLQTAVKSDTFAFQSLPTARLYRNSEDGLGLLAKHLQSHREDGIAKKNIAKRNAEVIKAVAEWLFTSTHEYNQKLAAASGKTCPSCEGKGEIWKFAKGQCSLCGGDGWNGNIDCGACDSITYGVGKAEEYRWVRCETCGGTGQR